MNVSAISGLCNEWARIHRLAAWTAFWLIGKASTDDTIDAWHDLYSLPRNEMVHFLGELRQAASDYSDHTADDPLVRIVLACLLYTSDAADDLLCVDLGGRRIIKKKK